MTLIYINIGLIIFGIIGYIIWNLLKKTEKLENLDNKLSVFPSGVFCDEVVSDIVIVIIKYRKANTAKTIVNNNE